MADEEDKDIITLANITTEEWNKIRFFARKYFDSKKFGTDQLKCAVAGFAEWISTQERDFVVDVVDPTQIH